LFVNGSRKSTSTVFAVYRPSDIEPALNGY
jgi:hypothetical protein